MGLLDGSLQALDPTNGQTLWHFDSGDSLIASHAQDSLVSATHERPSFFPGVDGCLYHINHEDKQLEVSAVAPYCALFFRAVPCRFTPHVHGRGSQCTFRGGKQD